MSTEYGQGQEYENENHEQYVQFQLHRSRAHFGNFFQFRTKPAFSHCWRLLPNFLAVRPT